MFNLETERMAERFRARERKLREKKEQEEKEAAAKASVAITGIVNGQDATMGVTSPKEDERMALKRIREDEMQDSDDSHPPSKRMRVSPFGDNGDKLVRFDLPEPTLPSISVNGNAIPDSQMEDAFDPPSPSPASKQPTSLGANETESPAAKTNAAPLGLTQRVIHAPSRTPSPGPSTPAEFHASPALLAKLETALTSQTANLDVEQLEALRALCLNLLWKHRGDWDRDTLITNMFDAINAYLREIGELSEEEE